MQNPHHNYDEWQTDICVIEISPVPFCPLLNLSLIIWTLTVWFWRIIIKANQLSKSLNLYIFFASWGDWRKIYPRLRQTLKKKKKAAIRQNRAKKTQGNELINSSCASQAEIVTSSIDIDAYNSKWFPQSFQQFGEIQNRPCGPSRIVKMRC